MSFQTLWLETPRFRNPLTAKMAQMKVEALRHESTLPGADTLPLTGRVYDVDPIDGITGEEWHWRVLANEQTISEWHLTGGIERYHEWIARTPVCT